MSTVRSFPAIAQPTATLLILGSMPGVASLDAHEYYAHPRNGFWVIMAELFGFDADMSYELRCQALVKSEVAVWDVLQSCSRPGSLDSAIDKASRVANDFPAFFEQHPNIKRIGFNGAEAYNAFKRLALPQLDRLDLEMIQLPSSSPAYTLPIHQKTQRWQELLAA